MGKHPEGPYGGDGGKHCSLDEFTSIDKIGVACSTINGTKTAINGITIDYTFKGDHKSITFGGSGKQNPEEFQLQPGEYITSVEGKYGWCSEDSWSGVRELTFMTSSNMKKKFGDYKVGTSFKLPKNNGTIVGFFGRETKVFDDKCGRLDALGAYIEDGQTGGSSTGTGF